MSLLPFRDALIAIYDADAAVQVVTGRTTLNLVARGAQVYEENLPVLTYYIITSPQKMGTKGARKITVQFEAWARTDKADCFDHIETLMDRAEALFDGTNLTAQGIDMYRVHIVSREDGVVEDNVRSVRGVFTFDVIID